MATKTTNPFGCCCPRLRLVAWAVRGTRTAGVVSGPQEAARICIPFTISTIGVPAADANTRLASVVAVAIFEGTNEAAVACDHPEAIAYSKHGRAGVRNFGPLCSFALRIIERGREAAVATKTTNAFGCRQPGLRVIAWAVRGTRTAGVVSGTQEAARV
jgi:hypothetical protein